MALQKQSVPINFSQGLDTKTDPWQVAPGKMLTLQNTVFNKGGLLQKRNGYSSLENLPNETNTAITTFNGNLTAIGNSLYAYSESTNQWYDKGNIQPVQLSVLPLIRSNTNQIQADTAISSSGLICTVYTDNLGSTTDYKFAVADSTTGQNIIEPTLIPSGGVVTGSPRVFTLARHFVIVFTSNYSGTYHLQYIAITIANPTQVTTSGVDISTQYTPNSKLNFDGVVINNSLFLAWNGNDGGGAIRFSGLNSSLVQYNVKAFIGHNATTLSMSVDTSTTIPTLYASFIDSSNNGWTCAVMSASGFATVLAPTQLYSSVPSVNIASYANNGVLTVFYEVTNAYGYDSTIPTNYIKKVTCTQSGTVGSSTVLARSVGLASKAFVIGTTLYILTAYQSAYQPTYFLLDSNGNVISKLAYSNGGGYVTLGLPSVYVNDTTASICYQYKDQITAVNKSQGVANSAGIYAQVGINLANFDITSNNIVTAEIGNNLLISGGFLWAYDGYVPVEQNFHLWPDNVEATFSTTGGGLAPQQYFYQALYEWSDNQGNIFRSAPSVPVEVNLQMTSTPVTFTSVFNSGETVITVSSASGLNVGDLITDTSNPTNIQAYTYIIGISGTSVTLSLPTVGNSDASPGDTLQTQDTGTAISFTSTFSKGVSSITVSSTTGLYVGQFLTDITMPTNFQNGTYITSINGSVIGLSLPTFAASSGADTIVTYDTGKIVVDIPTLRLTYKIANPPKLMLYRWSTAQQKYYQVTSITSPLLNDPTVDYLTFTDTLGDGAILGNSLIYTTGGVVEDIPPPAVATMTLFQDRLWTLDAEDRSLLYFSKQVIEGTPVEMSDLFSYYVAPTTGAQGSTGDITALSAMDDKLIIFKDNAIYYVNGQGPDNTGANNNFSDPVFITSTVGCTNQQSIVFTPNGLMFQSDKGIWLLGRDLSTNYIGAPVEQFNSYTINSALNIPETNQVRFTLDNGTTLMYDYYYQQWGTFTNVTAIASTLYQDLHTYINQYGEVYQESPGEYLDGSNPVLMSLTTSWFAFAGLQGYQRAYFFYILGNYISPHKLSVSIAYDYNPAIVQNDLINPDNYTGVYGSDPLYGNNNYGGHSTVEPWKVFFQTMKCESFQITLTEVFDASFGVPAGAGLTLSGLNLIVGMKKGYRTQMAGRQVG